MALSAQAQVLQRPDRMSGNINNRMPGDSIKKDKFINVKLSGKTHYTDYKVISYKNDTTYIDTTLSIKKYYKFNFLRKDNFELMPFNNIGQPFNALGYNFSEASLLPSIGARAMHYNYYDIEDIYYYHVPTPTTELMYRTALEQGQVLDALFTFNTSKRHNASIAYKGLHSLGKYRYALSSQGNLRITYSYNTKNERYRLRAHIAAQDLTNQENGGLTAQSLQYFEDKNDNFKDRGRLETNFTNAQNVLRGNRYYLDHSFAIWQHKDSLKIVKNYLRLGHTFTYERKHADFTQNAATTEFFGDTFSTEVSDRLTYATSQNLAYLALKSPLVLGEVKFKAGFDTYKYGYHTSTVINNQEIPSTLKGTITSVGGEWNTFYKKFNIHAEAATILTGDFTGNYLTGTASYKQDSLFTFKVSLLVNSSSPNLNFTMHQSDYLAYNWLNNLKNERYRVLSFDLLSDKLLNAQVSLNQIDNYTFFDQNSQVAQADKTVNYLKVKVGRQFKMGKFYLDHTIMYQRVAQGSAVFRVPDLVTRNALYFADYVFKGDPLYLETGISFKYFTEYQANAYNPLLAEFVLQDDLNIGGFPMFDIFVNGQIQRTRLYFQAEHINSLFSKANYFSAPGYPYRDFVIRFGLVWNFFI